MYRFLALGDSYTVGEGVTVHKRWPNLAVQKLQEKRLVCDTLDVLAQTGWTTGDLLAVLDREPPQVTYDIVSLLIGVNNQYQGLKRANYRKEFETILHRAIQLAGGKKKHVIVVSIPDWSVSPFAENMPRKRIASQIDAFNAINRNLAGLHGCPYIDITPLSRTLTKKHHFAPDGLHPSSNAYQQWATHITLTMIRILAPQP